MAQTITIIGAGNMGASLLGGLIANHHPAENLWVTDTDTQKLDVLQRQFCINTTQDNQAAAALADVVVLAVKPQILIDVVKNIAATLVQKKPLIISIAAGIRVNKIQHALETEAAIVRAMPNMPALIGCGATALFANVHVSQQQHDIAETILRAVGLTVWIQDENLMDIITALSGSGPAYFFLIIEAMRDAAIKLGLPSDIAEVLTLQTAYGSARMALESDVDVVELRKRVTSPGGTTEKALLTLEENNVRDIFKEALNAAQKRSEELANLT